MTVTENEITLLKLTGTLHALDMYHACTKRLAAVIKLITLHK